MIKKLSYLSIATIVLYSGIFLTNYYVAISLKTHIDKSGGLGEKILGLCIFSALFFFIIKRSLLTLVVGFIIGMVSFFIILSMISSGFKFPSFDEQILLGEQLVGTSITFLVGLVYFIFSERQSHRRQ